MRYHLHAFGLVSLLFFASAGSCSDNGTEITGEPCESDDDCDDGLFCNGTEFCAGSVCARVPPPNCDDGIACTVDECSERRRACLNSPPDEDGDGEASVACLDLDGNPLGGDCDDADENRFPGNVEICDDANVDEDCDPETNGGLDGDGDGLVKSSCCNARPGGSLNCGNDCDDEDPAAFPGTQYCDVEAGPAAVKICQIDGTFLDAKCFNQDRCNVQPNGYGVCVPP